MRINVSKDSLKPTRFLLFSLVFFTLIDLIATMVWISGGWALEANPFMAIFVEKSLFLFVIVKLTFAFCGILILNHFRKRKIVFKLAFFAVLVYVGVTIHHFVGLMKLISRNF